MTLQRKEWIATDGTQYVKKINDDTYELVEALKTAKENYVINHGIINLNDYSGTDILDAIGTFGYNSIAFVKEQYGEEYNQVIAECIFELSADFQRLNTSNVDEVIKLMKEDFNIELTKEDFS